MAERAYEPKKDAGENLVIEGYVPRAETVDENGEIGFDRKVGESFKIEEWPYATKDPYLQDFLDAHSLVKRVAVAEAKAENEQADDSEAGENTDEAYQAAQTKKAGGR